MTLEASYRRALERIARHEIRGPVDEWSESAAYRELQDIALEALESGTMAARAKVEQEVRKRDKDRARQLRKESSAGKRHFVSHFGGTGAMVCVLNKGCARPDLVEVKVTEIVVDGRFGQPLLSECYRVGRTFTVNICNVYNSPSDAIARRYSWDGAKETP